MLQHFSTELDNLQKNSLAKVIYTHDTFPRNFPRLPAYGFTHANLKKSIFDLEILEFVDDFAIIFSDF